jgi:hypothetical protein
MPQKLNEWDPKHRTTVLSPQRETEEQELSDDEDALDEDEDLEDSDEDEDDERVDDGE